MSPQQRNLLRELAREGRYSPTVSASQEPEEEPEPHGVIVIAPTTDIESAGPEASGDLPTDTTSSGSELVGILPSLVGSPPSSDQTANRQFKKEPRRRHTNLEPVYVDLTEDDTSTQQPAAAPSTPEEEDRAPADQVADNTSGVASAGEVVPETVAPAPVPVPAPAVADPTPQAADTEDSVASVALSRMREAVALLLKSGKITQEDFLIATKGGESAVPFQPPQSGEPANDTAATARSSTPQSAQSAVETVATARSSTPQSAQSAVETVATTRSSTPQSGEPANDTAATARSSTPQLAQSAVETVATARSSTPQSDEPANDTAATARSSTPQSAQSAIETVATTRSSTPQSAKSAVETVATARSSTPQSAQSAVETVTKARSSTPQSAIEAVATARSSADPVSIVTRTGSADCSEGNVSNESTSSSIVSQEKNLSRTPGEPTIPVPPPAETEQDENVPLATTRSLPANSTQSLDQEEHHIVKSEPQDPSLVSCHSEADLAGHDATETAESPNEDVSVTVQVKVEDHLASSSEGAGPTCLTAGTGTSENPVCLDEDDSSAIVLSDEQVQLLKQNLPSVLNQIVKSQKSKMVPPSTLTCETIDTQIKIESVYSLSESEGPAAYDQGNHSVESPPVNGLESGRDAAEPVPGTSTNAR